MKNRILIIIPYFGKFPEWINLFLYSCGRNRIIDGNVRIEWLIYTDNEIPDHTCDNVIFRRVSFADYCSMVSKKLDFDFGPSNPYKLCDLKPFYGIIHSDDLKGYTHWGFGDLDLCYGNLSMLVNSRMLIRYDLITTHGDRIAGHFTVIRKESGYNDICFRIEDWQSKLSCGNLGLDEHYFTALIRPFMRYWLKIYRLLKHVNKKMNLYEFMNIPNKVHNIFSKAYIKEFYTSPAPKDGEVWTYEAPFNRILSPTGKELPYLHYLFFKKTPFWDSPHYWKPGFWQLEEGVWKTNRIFFDNERIHI